MNGGSEAPTPTPPPTLGEGRGERAVSLPRLAFIGAGKVGTALSTCLAELGYPVVAVHSVTPGHAEALAAALPGCQAAATPAAAASGAEVVFLTVPDSAIASVAAAVHWRVGMAAVHCGGALGLAPLEAARQAGALVGCLHPLYPCADMAGARRGLRRCSYGIVAEPELMPLLSRVAASLSGRWFSLPEGAVPLYHAAAALASNFSVALAALAVELWQRCGVPQEEAAQAVATLMEGMAANLAARGLPAALTGPMVRGDAGTVALHLAALERAAPELLPLYRELGRHTVALAARDGLAEERRREMEEVLTALSPRPSPKIGGGVGEGAGASPSPGRIRGTSASVELAARELRRRSTPAEDALWGALKGKQLAGLKFRRQHPLGQFILDFCCPAARLAIELDGAAHRQQGEYDQARTERLEAYGYRVLRFRNEEVLEDLGAVLRSIVHAATPTLSPAPPPRLGEGQGRRTTYRFQEEP